LNYHMLLHVRYWFAQTRFISLCNFVHLTALCFHFQMVIGKANLLPFAINHVSQCVSMLEFVSCFSDIPLRKFILWPYTPLRSAETKFYTECAVLCFLEYLRTKSVISMANEEIN
jgi:hypothetical protein